MEGRRQSRCMAPLVVLLPLLLFCHGHVRAEDAAAAVIEDTAERDVSTPLATVPVVTNPTATRTPWLADPVAAGGGSWCVASPSASTAALQVALDYACGQGGADCSAIQGGASCSDPDTVRDHASYAFNAYYQKNPVQTSCDFAGAAVLTTTDPSTSTCRYPATSTGASVLNTTTPLTPAYGNSPPAPATGYGTGTSPPLYGSMSPPDYGGNIGAAPVLSPGLTSCLLVAAVLSLNA